MKSQINAYLEELCKDPKPEFVRFLTERESSAGSDDPGCKSASGASEMTKTETATATAFLTELWCGESFLRAEVTLNCESSYDEISYTICVLGRESRYCVEKSLEDIGAFCDRTRHLFRSYPLPDVNLNLETRRSSASAPILDSKTDIPRLEAYLNIMLNDGDLCSAVTSEFLSCELVRDFPSVHRLILGHVRSACQMSLQQLLGFDLSADVEKNTFAVDADKNARMVSPCTITRNRHLWSDWSWCWAAQREGDTSGP